ncbi:hypothetical protein GCM10007416_33410 [Kroppenstedtia guangzhouensis]|uniref:Membrane protein YesL n=1 Tax=Kroppenstedtia guangzhouensis TaxID=1274356 RepID=A0ABQ1H5J7_9BACL|nr:hypothetical protein [Kroppenstedtia guangzhouensis]GGA57498.1 hypothetical protein GCM10007416_33410 [Kroppenstedtia guangzhouensis]
MSDTVQEALRLFRERFWLILLVVILYVVPMQLLYTFVVNYATWPFQLFGIPIWTTMIQAFFMFICLFLIQLPFISMAFQYAQNEEVRLGKTFTGALESMFSIYIMGIFLSLLMVIGSLIFIVPGFVLMILFFGVSCAAVMEEKTWWKGLKQSFLFGKEHFFKLLSWTVLFGVIDLIVSFVTYILVYSITGLYLVLNLSLIMVNGLIFSILFFIVAFYYYDWSDAGIDVVELNI